MVKKLGIALIAMGLAFSGISPCAAQSDKPWPAEKAWEWYNKQPWIVGCSFLPSTAVNNVEMWQAETFDPTTIDRELGLAEDLGFNSVRVFLNYVVWEADPDGLKERFEQFLKIADQHGLRVMPIFFDDCFKPEPKIGKQDEPEPGVHTSQWVQSPGAHRRDNKAYWPKLEQYVKDIVSTFAADRRIVIWELYNEPSRSLALMEASFQWARAAKPTQPMTTCIYGSPDMKKRIPELCDIVAFHGYEGPADMEAMMKEFSAYGRPLICTEWMHRPNNNTFETLMPIFRDRKIGCYNWGLVAGRTQTYLHFKSRRGDPPPAVWQHDIFRSDGTPYSADEVALIKQLTGRTKASSEK
jgi:hypothetical protein